MLYDIIRSNLSFIMQEETITIQNNGSSQKHDFEAEHLKVANYP